MIFFRQDQFIYHKLSCEAMINLCPAIAFLFHSLYDMLGHAPPINVSFWGSCPFAISVLNRDMSLNAWNRHLVTGSFIVDMGILYTVKNPSSVVKMTLWTFIQWHLPSIRLYTQFWSYYGTWHFTELQEHPVNYFLWNGRPIGDVHSSGHPFTSFERGWLHNVW